MSLAIDLLAAWCIGVVVGWLYFQVLWETVRRLPQHRRPGTWMAASLVLRLGILVAVFVWLARWGSWPALLAAAGGLVVARTVLVRRLRQPASTTEQRP